MRGLATLDDRLAEAGRRHGDRLVLLTSFQKEESVLIESAVRVAPLTQFVTIDTGVLFPETLATWRAFEERFGIDVRVEDATGDWSAENCCSAAKVDALERALSGAAAWVTGIRREQSPTRADAQFVEHDSGRDIVKYNPLADWTEDDLWSVIHGNGPPVQPAARRGLRLHRLHALHGARPGPRGPLGRNRQARVRAARRARPHRRGLRTFGAVAAAGVAAAALSVAFQHTPGFDATAWLIWGRQLSGGELHTFGGPSWKPLPVLFTTPFTLLGDDAAEALWLVVARTGGLLAIAAAYAVARRLAAGRAAGLTAAASVALVSGVLYDSARGDAEGLLVLLALLALLAHLDGRPRLALLLGAGAGLIRPETWPLLAVYGVWLAHRDRRALPLAALVGAGLLAAWLVPERLGSGDWLRAATRAQHEAPGTPSQSAFPFGATVLGLAIITPWPVLAGAVFAARRPSAPAVRPLAAVAVAYVVLVAVMAEFGFTGNNRYLILPAVVLCVVAATALPDLARRAPRGVAVAVAVSALALGGVHLVRDTRRLVTEQRVLGDQLEQAIAVAGGRDACRFIGANHFARQRVAWLLHLRQEDIRLGTQVERGTVFAREGTGAAAAPHPPVRRRVGEWLVRWNCPG